MNFLFPSCYTEFMEKKFVVWLAEIDKEDVPLVGGKGANLGEMAKIGVPVPPAFIVTAPAYFYFLDSLGLRPKIENYLRTLNSDRPESLEQTSQSIRRVINSAALPTEITNEIIKAYEKLGSFLKPALVAVRSSATAEDLPNASFAGQQETFLNVEGEASVIEKVRQCWASLWLPRAIFYRDEQKFDHFKVGIAVPVQKMIQSETSGVAFTIDPISNDKRKIVIEAIFGLGELIVQGQTIPDRYLVDKDTLEILSKEIAVQDKMLVKKRAVNRLIDVVQKKKNQQKVNEENIFKIAGHAKKIERHYFFPQDIEWAIENGEIFILQTRPITTIQKIDERKRETEKLTLNTRRLTPVLVGIGASPGIGSGTVKIIHHAKEVSRVATGEVIVSEMTNPDYVPAMKRAVAIVTDQGGRTSHAAIVSRELGIPCVVGTKEATRLLKTGQVITVDGAAGKIFRGGFIKKPGNFKKDDHVMKTVDFSYDQRLPKTATKVYVNLAEPERAKEIAQYPVDGVGLLRAEFMIGQFGVHPKKIIHDHREKEFINQLTEGIATFCRAFNPRPVVYRATDFKTNEYRNLSGGKDYEPIEANPMLGLRGARRYLVDQEVFELELAALKKVRNEKKFKNLWLMIPFVRTPQELTEVKKIVTAAGLPRGPSFHLWIMVEIPTNVICLEDFLAVGVDGVSIGSNDLTMLLLGVDRDNSEISPVYNEQDPAVLWSLEKIIRTCQKKKVTSSICGQAPSDFPDLVTKLVEWGVSSVSINPDALERTREIIFAAERRLCLSR